MKKELKKQVKQLEKDLNLKFVKNKKMEAKAKELNQKLNIKDEK